MRPTWKDAEKMSLLYGGHAHLWTKYLDLADGNEELAVQIKDYYRGTGEEKNYTIGQVIRDFWLREEA